jgi:hypothetical protein
MRLSGFAGKTDKAVVLERGEWRRAAVGGTAGLPKKDDIQPFKLLVSCVPWIRLW